MVVWPTGPYFWYQPLKAPTVGFICENLRLNAFSMFINSLTRSERDKINYILFNFVNKPPLLPLHGVSVFPEVLEFAL
jgi:hypothetical protein